MGPGLPGLGIASVFYVMAALLAPLRELVLTVQGRSSARRWRLVGVQFVLALTVVVALVAFYLGLAALVRLGVLPRPQGWNDALGRVPNVVWAFVTLTAVLAAVWLYALWDRFTAQEETQEMIAAAHRSGVVDVVHDLREVATGTPVRTDGLVASVAAAVSAPDPVHLARTAPMWATVQHPDEDRWSTLPRPEVPGPVPVPVPAASTAADSTVGSHIGWNEVAVALSRLPRPTAVVAAG